MIEDETVGPEREVTAEPLETCDLCGQIAPRLSVIRLAGRGGVSEPVEAIRVCEACRIRIEQAEVPFDEEIAAGLQVADD